MSSTELALLRKVLGAAEALLGARAIEGITTEDWALLERAVAEAIRTPEERDESFPDHVMRQQIERRRALLDGRWSDAVNWAAQSFDAFQRIGAEITACWRLPPNQAAARLRKIVSVSPHNFTTMLVLAWVETEKRYLERTAIQDEVDDAERAIDPDPDTPTEEGPATDDA